MCGKFTQMLSWSELVALSDLLDAKPDAAGDKAVVATPMRTAWVIHLDADGQRIVSLMVWGFLERGPSGRDIPRHMHARAETVDRLPTFANAFAARRGVLLVHTFNEGEEVEVRHDDGAPSSRSWTRQWTIRPNDERPIAIAVIHQPAPAGAGAPDGFVMVTTPANALIGAITDRMPAILAPGDWEVWLGETRAPPDEVKAVLRTWDSGSAWTMSEADPARRPPRSRKAASGQGELF